MIFNTKNKFAQLVESEQTKDESLLIQIVQTTWDQFNDFVSSNLRMLLIYLKDIAYLNFRQRDNLTTLKSTLRGQGSASDSDKSKSDLELTIKNNGLIFHDFNYPDYVNQLFAEDEVKHKQLSMTAYEPDQSVLKRDKLSVEKVIEESLTPYQLEMRKMRAIVKKAEMYKNEQITGAQEFRAQFTDLMKNINQSYTILKGGIAENKKNKDEKGEKSSFADDSALTSLNLFTKLKGKKKFNISEVKPRLKTATRIPSAVVKPVSQPVDGSQRRLSRPRSRQHTESSIKYEDSETGVKVRVTSTFAKSLSQGRRRSRDILDSMNRTRESSLKLRARRQRVTESDYSGSDYDIRRPRDFSSILFSEKLTTDSVLRSKFN